jgi:hypothetical protein
MRYRKPTFTVVGRRPDGRPVDRDFKSRSQAIDLLFQLEYGQVHTEGRVIQERGDFPESDQRNLYLRSLIRNHKQI